ncbi:MAG: lytic transglycosylase domain-containing protein [Clostridiales bacterium]|nr:lytic transglycosylase domain-containing protein [Clostridiales bacterium]MCD7827654.1 lytic transglycosylase domain-containing protein [Clostridiales bacterium]
MAGRKNKRRHPVLSFFAVCIVLVLIFIAGRTAYNIIETVLYPKTYSEYVEKYAAEYDVSETLLYAVIRTESGFDPESVSSAGARGLTQITEDTFEWLLTKTGDDFTFDDLFNPEVSIKYGAYFLSILANEYTVTETAVAAYHAGMGNVSSWLANSEYSEDGITLKVIPISDTDHYVNKVMSAIEKYEQIYS